MPSERRLGREEYRPVVVGKMLKRTSHDLDLLMGMLIQDPTRKNSSGESSTNRRQRKQGATGRHPLDIVDTNGKQKVIQPQKTSTQHKKATTSQQKTLQRHQHQQQKTKMPQPDLQTEVQAKKRSVCEDKENKRTYSLLPPLRRAGSVTSSIISRKSKSSINSNQSRRTNRSGTTIRSNATITSNSSYVKKNSGNFDGGNSKTKSNRSKNSVQHNRERIVAEFYKELEELEEISSSDSSDDETEKLPVKKIPVEEMKSHQRVEEYLMKLQNDITDEDEGCISDTTKSDLASESDDRSIDLIHNFDNHSYTTSSHHDKNNVMKDRKYIKHPSPPMAMRKIENLKLDVNKNIEHKNRTAEKTRHLPTKPREIKIVDSELQEQLQHGNTHNSSGFIDDLRSSFKRRGNNRKKDQEQGSFRKKDTELRDSFRKKELLKEDSYGSKGIRRIRQQKHSSKNLDYFYDDGASETSCSTDSAHGSTQSLSTVSSISVVKHHNQKYFNTGAVPKNFIPGHTKGTQERKRQSPFMQHNNYNTIRTATFCFKGVSCKVSNNAPRTFRAMAHAGCIAMVIPGPSSHKCSL